MASARMPASRSMGSPPLNKMPRRAALAIALSSVAGVLMTSAQGEATTSSVMAR
jgi:hypothetical protein